MSSIPRHSELLNLFPRWSERPISDETSRDALGFQRFAADFADRILPDITVLTVRARQYAFICWAIGRIQKSAERNWEADRAMTNDQFVTLYNRFEKVLALSEAVRHHDNKTDCRWIGQLKTRSMASEDWPTIGLDFRLIAAERRGGGLAQYQTSLVKLGLLKWETEKTPLAVTEEGAEVGEAFSTALGSYARQIESFCLDMEEKRVSRSDLERWSKRFCLSEMTRAEAKLLRPLLVSGERAITLSTVNQIPHWLMHNETGLLREFYSCPDTDGRAFDLKQIQFYQYYFSACLTLFYSLFDPFQEINESHKRSYVVDFYLKHAGLAGKEPLTDVARRTTTPRALVKDEHLSPVTALRLLRVVWEGAKRQPAIYGTAPRVHSLALEEVGKLFDDFASADVRSFLAALVDLMLEKHRSVFASKGKSPWIALSGDSIAVQEFDTLNLTGNPYQVHLNSLRSLIRDLEHAHD